MALRVNPTTGKLDLYAPVHTGLASYKFSSTTSNPIVDPGNGNMVFNTIGSGEGTEWALVFHHKDKNGFEFGGIESFIAFVETGYDVWVFIHSKRDPAYWFGGFIYATDTIIPEGEERSSAYILYFIPVLGTETFDEEEDEYVSEMIPDNDEVIVSIDFAACIFTIGGV